MVLCCWETWAPVPLQCVAGSRDRPPAPGLRGELGYLPGLLGIEVRLFIRWLGAVAIRADTAILLETTKGTTKHPLQITTT